MVITSHGYTYDVQALFQVVSIPGNAHWFICITSSRFSGHQEPALLPVREGAARDSLARIIRDLHYLFGTNYIQFRTIPQPSIEGKKEVAPYGQLDTFSLRLKFGEKEEL